VVAVFVVGLVFNVDVEPRFRPREPGLARAHRAIKSVGRCRVLKGEWVCIGGHKLRAYRTQAQTRMWRRGLQPFGGTIIRL
jgi:hypothetical protein